jgi:hypothetical protein
MSDNNNKEIDINYFVPLKFWYCNNPRNHIDIYNYDFWLQYSKTDVKLKNIDELIIYPKQKQKRKCNDEYGKNSRLKK